MKKLSISIMVICLFFSSAMAGESIPLDNENQRFNYSYGYQLVETFKNQGVDINLDILLRGINDALAGSAPLLKNEEMLEALRNVQHKMRLAKYKERQAAREKDIREGNEFLASISSEPDVVTLPSGLRYKVIKEGEGKTPGPRDSVSVHYRGTLINGRAFDSSKDEEKPPTFKVNEVIAGWSEALQLMREGAKWQLYVPPKLGFGDRGPLEDKTLIYDLELISVIPAGK